MNSRKHFPIFYKSIPHFLDFFEEDWDIMPKESSGLSISEDENNIYVEAALPGLKPEEIEITLDKNILWIKGEKKEEEKKKKYYKKASSSFSYRVIVPNEIDETKEIDATYKDGIMKVCFPKSKKTKPKKINIKKL